ncbi:MAG: hypothetical protein LBU44_00880 [Mediterranea sp.]|jgi:hypothetical protein|nr:hypothetical protein [Mediterranea sp.]
MASRKKLKRNVDYIAGGLCAKCLLNITREAVNKDEMEKIIVRIFIMQEEFTTRLNHPDTENTKEFYKQFYSDFNARQKEIIDAIAALNPGN